MPARGLFQWVEGGGWLIFSGGETAGSPLRAQALARAGSNGGVIYISTADDGGESLQEDIEDLGAPAGYVLDIQAEDAESIVRQITEASFIVIEVGESLNNLHDLLKDAPITGLRAAYERGAIILVEGLAMNLFGGWMMTDGGQILEGLNWVKSAFLESGVTGADESRAVQAVLAELPECVAIEIGVGSALALGAGGEIEIWGQKQVTVSLGSSYQET